MRADEAPESQQQNMDVIGGRRMPLWVTTAVLALSGMVTSLTFTLTIALVPALPSILEVSSNDASWVITITLLTSSVVTPILSRMADMYGKKKMLIASLSTLVIGSIIVATGDTFWTMLVGRSLQGFAPSLVPIGISLLRDILPRERISSAVAMMSGTVGVGTALGLPISGFLYEHFGWQAVFVFTAVLGAALVVGILFIVPESPVQSPGAFDWTGTLLFSVALTALLLVISKAGQWELAVILAMVGVVAAGFLTWVPQQLKANNPMVDLRTMTRRPVLLTNISSFFVTTGTFANYLMTPQEIQAPIESGYGLGESALVAGLAMIPAGVTQVVIAPLSGRLLDAWGGRTVLLAGNAFMVFAYLYRIFFADALWMVILGSVLVSIGTGLSFASMPTLIMASVPRTDTAAANGINSLIRAMSMSVTSALVALLATVMAVSVSGQEYLSSNAMVFCFAVAAASGLVGAGVAFFIPVDTRTLESDCIQSAKTDAGHGVALITGRVTVGDGVGLVRPPLVNLLTLDGAQVDWARADLQGRYSAVLPGPGRYLMVANTAGWAPQTQLIDVHGAETVIDITVTKQLVLRGRVTADGGPLEGAVIVLSRSEGALVGSVRTDVQGRYEVQLPPVGPHIVTAIDSQANRAHSRKLVIGVQSTVCDLKFQGLASQ
ncbi:MFS transporter [Citricoccus sp. NPDC055426]|uniref:MFS transporter n=1 Tax=Citricoccus sp. NPDC055426 TaxID=3155536 RepID=UPI003421B472